MKMTKNFSILNFLIIFVAIACNTMNQNNATGELYKTANLTAVNSFTSGAEGPAVDKEGNLYAVNYSKEGTVGKITPTGDSSIFIELTNGSIGNGIRFNSKGEMLIADYTNHNILKVDMVSKRLSVYAHNSMMNQPNDIAIDSKDRLYASDPNWKAGTGRIWRIDTDGKTVLLEDSMGTTNGIEVNFGMDGMRCDVDGNLYITRHGKGTVAKVSSKGELLKEIALIGKTPSNIAFGGPDGKTAYVTLQDNGNIESFRVEAPGREWKKK